ncbi:MAG: ATP-binding protein [Chromatiaceae bacterium]
MNIQLADITVHIDQELGPERRAQIESAVREIEGVVGFHNPSERPHLNVVEYNPDKTNSTAILSAVTRQGVHAELVGL